jgi:hypothetical protein
MAPRPLESKSQFLARLRAAAARGEKQVRFGGHHHTHAVVSETGAWRVRPLVVDPAKAQAFRDANQGMYMPEHHEMLGEPGPTVALEAPTLDEMIARLDVAWAQLLPTSPQ